jgi:hypothetical protein
VLDFSAIAALMQGFEATKNILSAAHSVNIDAATKVKINEAQIKLGETVDQLFNLRTELIKLQDENRKLTKALEEQENWSDKAKNYKPHTSDGGAVIYQSTGLPRHSVCPSCFEEKKLGIL